MKSFEKWKTQELFNHFGIKKTKSHPQLTACLLAENVVISDKEQEQIEALRLLLEEEVDNWQEDELKSFFIIPLIEIINFRRNGYYKPFTQRNIVASAKNMQGEEVEINGRVEFLVAKGFQDPENPFFFVHEYKPEARTQNDPIGQLLAAMYATQLLNSNEQILYGLYIIGRNWFFVVLDGKEYVISKAYDATQIISLLEIARSLKKIKEYIDIEVLGGQLA